MVEYIIKTPPLERLGAAVVEALDEGVTQKDLVTLVMSTVDTYTPPKQISMGDEGESFQVLDRDTVYSELPPDLIDLRTAAKVYGLRPRTLQEWVSKNRVPQHGWLSIPAFRGRRSIVVREEDLREYMKGPRAKGGRPPKISD